MGFPIEFNWVLALRNYKEHIKGKRISEECIPAELKEGENYQFSKEGYRIYPLDKIIDLAETKGEGKLSEPIAKIKITRIYMNKNETSGSYTIIKKLKQYKK